VKSAKCFCSYSFQIKRLLGSKDVTTTSLNENEDPEAELSSLKSKLNYEQTLTRTLYLENERLRQEVRSQLYFDLRLVDLAHLNLH